MQSTTYAPEVGDAAVLARTGKRWDEWFALLDAAGGQELDHKGIVALVHDRFGLADGWWCQTVTVGYERARGKRQVHEKVDGFAASASLTLNVPVAALYAAWADETARARWLAAPLAVRKATPERSLRVTWADGTWVDVMFYAKGAGKSQVAVQHTRLPDAPAVAALKAYWKEHLAALKVLLTATPTG